MKSKFSLKKILPCFIFLVGFLIAVYPLFSQWYYRINANEVINSYIKSVEAMDKSEIEEKLKLSYAYNRTLDPSRLSDPFSDEEKRGRAEYARMLEVEEKIGYIEIPKIDQELPIYAGTSESVLQKGAGHLEGTSLPVGGDSTHTVITAHRGLPEARLFTDLDKIEKGDVFYIHVLDRVLAYKVDQILTVKPSDFDPILVVDHKDYATLLTCTPYSINSHRLLVRGYRIDYTAPVKEDRLNMIKNADYYKYYLLASIFIILILIYVIYRSYKSYKKVSSDRKDDSYEK